MIWPAMLFNLCVGLLLAGYLLRGVRRFERRADKVTAEIDQWHAEQVAKIERFYEEERRKYGLARDEIRGSMRAKVDAAIAEMGAKLGERPEAGEGTPLQLTGRHPGGAINEERETASFSTPRTESAPAQAEVGILVHHQKTRKLAKTRKLTTGFRLGRHNLYRQSLVALLRARVFAFRGKRLKKRQFRRLWIIRINAACRLRGIRYSEFIQGLQLALVALDRKSLSEIAIHDPAAFDKLVALARSKLPKSGAE